MIERKKALQDSITAIFTKLFHQDKPSIQDRIAHALPLGEVSSVESKLDSTPTPPPQGWEMKTLGDICELINRNWREHYYQKTFPYIQISDVMQRDIMEYTLTDYDKAPSRAKTMIKTGELIISLTRPNLGAFAVIKEKYNNFVVSSGFAVLDSGNITTNYYIKYVLQSQVGINIFNQIMSGAIYPAISQGDLQNLQIPLPPLAVQEQIVTQVGQIEAKIATTKQSRLELERELECYLESSL